MPVEIQERLTATELSELSKSEAIIEAGAQTFIEVGNALKVIQEGKLYRATHKTFQLYCKERWGWDKRRAYQLIEAACVVENVNQGTQNVQCGGEQNSRRLPSTEREARPLAMIPAEQQAAVWADVVEECAERGEPITGAAVQAKVDAYKAQSEPYSEPFPPDDADDETEEPDEQSATDRMRASNHSLEMFARKIVSLHSEAITLHSPHLEKAGRLEILLGELKAAAQTIRVAKGAGLCPKCNGDGCRASGCYGTGWLNKQDFEQASA
jgi:hypothetical protein